MTRPTIITVTPPSIEPVSLDEARAQLSLYEDQSFDLLIARLIAAARASAEAATGMRCMTQTVRLELDEFPDDGTAIDLGCYPVASITSVKYDDSNGVEQTLVGGSDYWPSLSGMYPLLAPIDGWPDTYDGKPASVRIVMVVGNTSASNVPQDVRHAILLRMTEMFERRGEAVEAVSVAETPLSMRGLLAPHTRWTA